MKTILKGTKLTVEMNKEEEDIFFRKGLQLIIDRDFGGKVKVMPPESVLKTKKTKTVEASDEMVEECIKEAVVDAIKCFISKRKIEQGEKGEQQNDKPKGTKGKSRKIQGGTKTKRK